MVLNSINNVFNGFLFCSYPLVVVICLVKNS